MVEVARQYSRFLWVESCGQCPPCKLGTEAITSRLDAIEECRGSQQDVDDIGGQLRRVTDSNRCYLGTQEQLVVSSLLRGFPEEFAAHLEGFCPRPRSDLAAPLLLDVSDGRAVYDERHRRKRPDWTYED
jgi:NADH-quinone oxidoreductase subunit F